MVDVEQIVRRMLGGISAPIAALKDGTAQSDGHRVLNFQGAGVTVTDDSVNRRANIYIPGAATGGATVSTDVYSTAGVGKVFVLGSEPAGWQNTGFNDSGWAAPVAETGTTFGNTISGATWITAADGSQPAGLTWLHRVSFTLPTGSPLTASLTIQADNYLDGAWINGTAFGSFPAWDVVPVAPPASVTIPLTALVAGGSNLLAFKVRNAGGWTSVAYHATVAQPAGVAYLSNILSADVSMTSSNVFVDGPSITLGTGTWLVTAQMQFANTGAVDISTKLWDGTTVFASGSDTHRSIDSARIPLSAIITLSSATLIKASAAPNVASTATMKAAVPINPSGNNATQILAIRIA